MWILDQLWCQNCQFWMPKTDLNTKTLQPPKYCKTQRFFNDFGVRGVRFGSPNRTKNIEKTDALSKCSFRSIFDRFCGHFGAILGSKGSQMEAKAPQRELKGCQKATQRLQNGHHGPYTCLGLASMGAKASLRTLWRQKALKSSPN